MRDKDKSLAPIHPGEILRTEFLEPMGITQYRLAKILAVQPLRISEIVRGKRGITADTALRLGRYFGLSATYWMNLQALYEIEIAEDRLEDRLEKEVKPRGGLAA
ncbi:MAG: HigA family addiction module antitoxin [Candidatus Aminicenantes bacterium]|nr:HigA family addiction module antitoxin [Candidatus Aminicenantes bacterium]